jgi:hypothetical protein
MEPESLQNVSQSGSAPGMEHPLLAVIRVWNDAKAKHQAATDDYEAAMKGVAEEVREVWKANPDGFEDLGKSSEEHITQDKEGWSKLLASINQKMRVSCSAPT